MGRPIDLNTVADKVKTWCSTRQLAHHPYGTFDCGPGWKMDFYTSTDIAIIRWLVGEDLKHTLSPEQRSQWAGVINAHQTAADGRYGPEMNHYFLHANGMALNALCILGERCRYPIRHFDVFNTADRIGIWLSYINWNNPWTASHLVWGGPVFWMNSSRADPDWKEACFDWFERQLNLYGSWPREFPPTDTNPIAQLGCAVHIWPLYRHTGRPVPGLERLADFVVEWQNPEGYWDEVGRYGTMDALYVLSVAIEQDLPRKAVYRDALYRYVKPHFAKAQDSWVSVNAHYVLGWTSCIGYLQRGLPDEFSHDFRWGDIFDLNEVYQLDAVTVED